LLLRGADCERRPPRRVGARVGVAAVAVAQQQGQRVVEQVDPVIIARHQPRLIPLAAQPVPNRSSIRLDERQVGCAKAPGRDTLLLELEQPHLSGEQRRQHLDQQQRGADSVIEKAAQGEQFGGWAGPAQAEVEGNHWATQRARERILHGLRGEPAGGARTAEHHHRQRGCQAAQPPLQPTGLVTVIGIAYGRHPQDNGQPDPQLCQHEEDEPG
jgi:hypothetical protein